MSTGIIITARVESNRLYRKVLQEINGKPTIEILLDHLINDKYPVVLAIPESSDDDKLEEIGEAKGIEVYRGQDKSPLHRLYECAKQNEFDNVVRITTDDILIDLTLLFLQIDFHVKGGRDYTYMARCPEGIAGEVFSLYALEKIIQKVGRTPIEFVSYHVKNSDFNWIEFYPPMKEYQVTYRLTMDYPEDLILLRVIHALLKKNFGTLDIINLIAKNKYLLRINNLPKVTIFTPVYNTEKYIVKTLDSVFNQTFKDFEYIIIDDGSTDRSCQRIAEYMSQLHYYDRDKIRFIRNSKNKGQAWTSNRALEMARGKYLMCLDSDDMLTQESLQIMIDILDQEYSDGVIGGYCRINENGDELEIVKENDKHLGCALVSRWVINELKFKEGIRYQIGTEFLERLKQNCTLNYYKDVLWYYRKRDGQLTQQEDHPENQ